MTSEPDTALRWAAGNIGRFLLIWLLVTTAVHGHDRLGRRRSPRSSPLRVGRSLLADHARRLPGRGGYHGAHRHDSLLARGSGVVGGLPVRALLAGPCPAARTLQIFAVALAPLLWIVFVQNDPPEVGYRSPGHIPLRNVRPAAERVAGSRALAQWPSVNARALGGHRASRLPVVYASRFRQHA